MAAVRTPICNVCGLPKDRAHAAPDRWLTKQEVGQLLSLSLQSVNRLIDSGALRAQRKLSPTGSTRNTVRITAADLEAYRKKNFQATCGPVK